MVESINNIFGIVKNPYNLKLSAGGSSGGEAALLASKGSILASGTDGGGSLRFPAAFCGVCKSVSWLITRALGAIHRTTFLTRRIGSFKPSRERMPGRGVSAPRSGSESVNAGLGPLAKTVAGLELWIRAQLASEPWNEISGCIPMPWDIAKAQRCSKRMKFAVVWDDGVVKPTPPVTVSANFCWHDLEHILTSSIQRALEMTVAALSKAGHTIVSLPKERIFPLHRRSLACTMLSNVQDGGRTVMKHINASGEPVIPRTAVGSDASALTAAEVFANHLLRAELSSEYNELWHEFGMDAILAPAVAHPANPHGQYISNSYATVYNMLDYVTGTVPVTTVDEQLDQADDEWYQGEVYETIEPIRFPYDRGDREMKQLCKRTYPSCFSSQRICETR